MSYKIILRTKPSPYTLGNDVTKKSVLSHKELDNNIINLKGKLSKDVEVQGNDLIIKKVDGSSINVNLSGITGEDTYVTGGTYDNSTGLITFSNNDGSDFDVDLGTIDLNDTFTTAATLNNNTLVFDTTDQVSAYTVNLSGITIDPAGNDEEVQFNESGSFGADSIFKFHRNEEAFTLGYRDGNIGSNSVVLNGTSSNPNEASGEASFAEGRGTIASNPYCHAEGNNTEASGTNGAHAEGALTIASQQAAHAEGVSTEASGLNSHAEGDNTKATSYASHSQNGLTETRGQYSHAGGLGVPSNSIIASGDVSFVHSENDSNFTGVGAEADRSAILGGLNNQINSSATNSVLLGGSNIVATEANTTYVPNLNIDSTPITNPSVTSILGRQNDGSVVERSVTSINNASKYAETIPSGSTGTVTTIIHNLNDEDVIVQLWKNNNELIGGTINNKTANSVDVSFDADPAADVRVVVKA